MFVAYDFYSLRIYDFCSYKCIVLIYKILKEKKIKDKLE